MIPHVTHPWWLLALIPALAWIIWLSKTSDASIQPWRRWFSCVLRVLVTVGLVLALAGFQWRREIDLMNVVFLLDRSESIPAAQQENALRIVRELLPKKHKQDTAALVPFAADSALENTPSVMLDVQTINAVVTPERTDIAGAIRLATAAFPEQGQKKIVLLSDGNENVGDAFAALMSARPLGVSLDVIPLGVQRAGDVSVEKINVPNQLSKGQVFEPRVFVESSQAQPGTLRIYRNDQLLGEQKVDLVPGRNSFQFPQQLDQTGLYRYDAQLEVNGDPVPQNNRAAGFTSVKGEPRILVLSSDPSKEESLAAALRSARFEVMLKSASQMPANLAELQSYDAIFLCNVAAGELSRDQMRQLEGVVRDFGTGLVCLGGDQSFTAGGYRGTPLETILPVGMDLDSKKVLPKGAVALVMHGMEFNNGNKVARDCALGVLDTLGPQDEMGVLLWNGTVDWLFPLGPVGNKQEMGRLISGMNQGDLPGFQDIMSRAHAGLQKSTANLKHMIVFSDGDPGPPTSELMSSIRDDRITVSTVLIAGHAGPNTMIRIADEGGGRFYDVRSADALPQIFLKEAAVILKSAIFESPFKPTTALLSEPIRGIPAAEFPTLKGYVATSPKSRAEIPLVSDKGDPILAHWQYGLGRTVAFTSDARTKWAADWLAWPRYQQFWTQVAQWAIRRLDSAEFSADVVVERGTGHIQVEAVDKDGNYRNFLTLQASVLSPKGERQLIRLDQIGPGRYEASFPTKDVGSYIVNILELRDGQVRATQSVGTSVNFSPEFANPNPNLALLSRLAESGGGRILDIAKAADNPFELGRQISYHARDAWEPLLQILLILFMLDVALRRIDVGREEWVAFRTRLASTFGLGPKKKPESEESLAALLARKESVRTKTSISPPLTAPSDSDRLFAPSQMPASLQTPPASAENTSAPSPEAPTSSSPSTDPSKPVSTTSRLLDAKRRASQQKPRDPNAS